jgi:hypothetical protein
MVPASSECQSLYIALKLTSMGEGLNPEVNPVGLDTGLGPHDLKSLSEMESPNFDKTIAFFLSSVKINF